MKDKPVVAAAGVKIVKSGDYERYLSAGELVRLAESKSQRIIKESHDAYEAEKERGYREGIDQGKKKIAETVTSAVLQCEAYVDSIETQIVNTIISALKNVLSEIGEQDVIYQLVKKALLNVRKGDRLMLKVSAGQADVVRRLVSDMNELGTDRNWIEVIADHTLQNGSCIITSKAGSADISLDVQLELIRTILAERMMRDKSDE